MELELIVKDNVAYCTSRDVADRFGKEHGHVLRDIQNIKEIDELFYAANFGLVDYTDKKGEKRPQYLMTEEGCMLLTMGYTGKEAFAIKIIFINTFKKMKAYIIEQMNKELARNNVQTVKESALETIDFYAKLSVIFDCPKNLALHEGVKLVKKETGIDLLPLLQGSSLSDNIETKWLEPTELGKQKEISGARVNEILCSMGYQSKSNGVWIESEKAKGYCQKHLWTKPGKSGYNLKWNNDFFNNIFGEYLDNNKNE